MATAITSPPRPQNTIVLKDLGLGERYGEGRVNVGKTIKPGMLIEQTSSGLWQPHSTAGGYAERVFAVELGFVADIPGLTYNGGTVDDTYAAGDLVRFHRCHPGDEVYGLLPASATAVTSLSFLTSNGDGTLKLATSSDQRLMKAIESVDNSAGSSQARCPARAV